MITLNTNNISTLIHKYVVQFPRRPPALAAETRHQTHTAENYKHGRLDFMQTVMWRNACSDQSARLLRFDVLKISKPEQLANQNAAVSTTANQITLIKTRK